MPAFATVYLMFRPKITLRSRKRAKLNDTQPNSRKQLLRYLLGTLPPAEREAFELRLIEDEEFSQAIEMEEFELIDEYASGSLLPGEQREIKRWVEASPELRARVLITQRLHRTEPSRSHWYWWLLGVATVTTCLLLLTITRTPSHSIPASTSSTRVTHPVTKPQQDTILLAAVRQRGSASIGAPAVYTLHPANATRLQILLPPSAQSATYTVQLQDVAPITNIKPQGPADAPYLELTFPPGALYATRYRLSLNSPSEHYELAFQVVIE
jgi:anti-sigma factor RsiW